MNKQKHILSIIAITILCFVSFFCAAQPGGGGDPGGGEPVPITGIEILLALGGLLGVKRLLGLNQKTKKS